MSDPITVSTTVGQPMPAIPEHRTPTLDEFLVNVVAAFLNADTGFHFTDEDAGLAAAAEVQGLLAKHEGVWKLTPRGLARAMNASWR